MSIGFELDVHLGSKLFFFLMLAELLAYQFHYQHRSFYVPHLVEHASSICGTRPDRDDHITHDQSIPRIVLESISPDPTRRGTDRLCDIQNLHIFEPRLADSTHTATKRCAAVHRP